jgi:hypothetical protein
MAGCENLPSPIDPVFGPVTSGQTLRGQVNGAKSSTRVGLLAAPQAGKKRIELSSTSAAGGSFALPLTKPRIEMLESSEDKSFVFALSAYEDVNGNGTFDDGTDTLKGAASGSFRWFAAAGPSNAAGWNVLKDGVYTQAFDVAYAI